MSTIVLSDAELLELLKQSRIKEFNAYREEHREQKIDLTGSDLRDRDLSNANLSGVNLTEADLTDATLRGTSLNGANLFMADLTGVRIGFAGDIEHADFACATMSPKAQAVVAAILLENIKDSR